MPPNTSPDTSIKMSNDALAPSPSGSELSIMSFQSDWFINDVKRANFNHEFYFDQLAVGIKIASDVLSFEQCTARYAMSLFQLYFPPDNWTLVPQWITRNGNIPDLSIETLTIGKGNKKPFYKKVMV